MRVLHIISCLVKSDGHSLFCMRLAERLLAQGHVQTIFTLPSGGDKLPDPQRLVHHADGRLLRFLNVSLPFGLERQIAALALFFKPDVIHLHGGWHPVLFYGARVARRMGIPILLSLHGSLRPAVVEGDRRLKKRLAWHLYQRRLVQMSSLIHVSTETEKEDLARLGFDKPAAVVPNGVDVEEFSRKDAPSPCALTPLNLETSAQRDGPLEPLSPCTSAKRDGTLEPLSPCTSAQRDGTLEPSLPRTVLYLGRLHPLKGLDLLISAWALVRSSLVHYCDSALVNRTEDGESVGNTQSAIRNRQSTIGNDSTHARMNSRTNELLSWQLVIAGPDHAGHKAELVKEAKRLGLRVEDVTINELMNSRTNELLPDLIFTGPLYGEEKTKAMQHADLFVLPTRSDNFGIAVAEALACGVPVITTKGAPWSELLGKQACLADWPDSRTSGVAEWQDRRSAVRDESPTQPTKPANPATPANLAHPTIAADGRCGWWVDIGAEPLAAALREAMSLTDEERRAMGENGRRLVERKYRWKTVSEQMAEVYSRVAE